MFSRLRRLLRTTGSEIAVLWYACKHPSTPRALKLAAVALLAYVISPIDLVPDALPVIGWVDDVTLLAFGIPALLKLMPPQVLADARLASRQLFSKWAFWRA